MDKNKYNRQIEKILENLRNELFEVVKKHGEIKLFVYDKHRLVVGSLREAVVDRIYISDNKLMLTCCNWIDHEVVFDGELNNNVINVGYITYTDQLEIYKLVCDIIS